MDKMGEDIAIMKTEIIHLRIDINKVLSILLESENAVLRRTAIAETKLEDLEEKVMVQQSNSFNIKAALVSLGLGLLGSICVAVIEFWNRK